MLNIKKLKESVVAKYFPFERRWILTNHPMVVFFKHPKYFILKHWKFSLEIGFWIIISTGGYYLLGYWKPEDAILRICLILLALIILIPWRLWKKSKPIVLEHRERSLIGAGVLGLVLALCMYHLLGLNTNTENRLYSSLILLALGLPTFFILWLFRTHDVQRRIDKTQESINNSSFFEAARMLASGNTLSEKIALGQLAFLKATTGFDERKINLLTNNLFLSKVSRKDIEKGIIDTTKKENFSYVILKGLDLSSANLVNLNLTHADLEYAHLVGADLGWADLGEANLVGVDLLGANLENAHLREADLRHANLESAHLRRADLGKANVCWANLREADLRGADLRNITFAKFGLLGYGKGTIWDYAIYDEQTEGLPKDAKKVMEYRPSSE